ncbi:hypothetical protein U9M48_000179 [Paspalum notatum var. saurae]|uniref:Scarecrow-like protein 9 n=1 Tax=Paspalum notatum var. saurae TaxID=547442 RepID=A0AAQ3SH97_PASNO
MAATPPENPADPPDDEPFSPSVFLDLPPTPNPNPLGDADDEDPAASSDDQVLLFIRRMLMEDEAAEDGDILYQQYYPGHPALLQAEQPFAQILSWGSTATSSSNAVAITTNSSAVSGSAITNAAFADATWPYDPDELSSQLLLSSSTAAGAGVQLSVGEDRAVPAGDDCVITMDLLNQAFLKGMEEGSKFLPTNTLQPRVFDSNKQRVAVDGMPIIFQESSSGNNGTGRGGGCKNRHSWSWEDDDILEAEAGRRSKLMAPAEPDESGEVADGVFNKAYEAAIEKMHNLSTSVPGGENEEKAGKGRGRRRRRRSRGGNEAVDLRTLLIHCAEAVSSGNHIGTTELLRQIKQRSSPTGDASQRLAHCFAHGLELRLAGTPVAQPTTKGTSVADFLKAYQLYLHVCCFQMVAFKFSRIAICKATVGRNKVHIVDYGGHQGSQWPFLLGYLAAREGGPPEVRITGIAFPQPGFRPAARIDETGRRLTDFARRCELPFRFRSIVAARWETVCADDVDIQPDEVLVVNGLFHFGRLMDEDDVENPSPRDMVLANIRDMRPDVFILCVENSSYGAPFFVMRFREALFYYSAMFDMMDATAPRDSAERVVVEEEVLGRCAINAIACEGPERVERPETYKQWQVRCRRAGLRQLPLLPSTVKFLSDMVKNGYHKDFAEEPFSPSDFLNLAASPHADGDGPAAQDGDQVLPFIARMLMEEDDNNLYEYPDHTALLQAQQTFADILSSDASTSTSTTNTFTLSPPSSSDAFAGAAWPYDPVQLSQQLLSRTTTTTTHIHNKAAENATITTMPAAAADEEEEHNLQNRVNMDMLNHAFLKGLEEANKFLPTTNGLLLDLDVSSKGKEWMPSMFQQENTEEQGRGRNRKSRDDHVEADQEPGRSSKLMALEPEEAGEEAQEIAQDAYQSVVDGMQAMGITDSEKSSRKAGSGTEAVDLRTLLIHCAQAMATGRDHLRATELLATIKQRSSSTGDATQRLAHCFARGLEARLAGAPAATAKRASAADLLRAYVQYTEVCCFEIMAFKFSNLVICRALAAGIESGRRKKKVHVVDYGYNYGFQWPCLLSLWSQQEGGPPEMRITAIDLPQPGFRPAARIDATGRCISDFARRHGVPFKFRGVAARWETVRAEDLDIDPDEVLVVNGLLRLEGLSDEGADGIDSPSPRDTVLANIRAMRPDAFVLCVENSSYGSPFFATRFREALFYHAAMFDMMDATTAGAPAAAAAVAAAERVLVEQELLGRRAVNVVACEGTERVERPEAYRQWQVRCGRAGLRQAALDPEIVSAVRKVVELKYHRDFFVDVDDQWLLQGWKGRQQLLPPTRNTTCRTE